MNSLFLSKMIFPVLGRMGYLAVTAPGLAPGTELGGWYCHHMDPMKNYERCYHWPKPIVTLMSDETFKAALMQ